MLVAGKGLKKFKFDFDEIARTAFGDGYASCADLVITVPIVDRADTRRRAILGLLHRRVDFPPWVPSFPLMKFVHLRERGRWGRGEGGAARDAKLRWLQGDDDDEHDDDDSDGDENGFEHGGFLQDQS